MLKPQSIVTVLSSCLLAVSLGSACGGEEKAATDEAPKGPVLGVLELPVSLRSSDAVPTEGRKVEAGLAEVRVDGATVLTLDSGKVLPADRAGDELPKLKAALQTPSSRTMILSAHSGLPYETIAFIMSSAHAAGIADVALAVRKPGGSTDAGWAVLKGFQITPRTDDDVPFASVQPHTWDEMTAAWQTMHDACRGSQNGSCAYVPVTPAKGGKLKIVLHAAGQGVNLDFFRVGLTPEELAAEEKARAAELATKKEDVVQGRAGKEKVTDIEAELAEGPPASEALFQFRSQDALATPSALTETIRPLCGSRACGAVVSAESATLLVRVASLIGAAFPDGGAAPVVAFELPWTVKPKPVAPPPVEPAAAPEPKAKPAKAAKHEKAHAKAKK